MRRVNITDLKARLSAHLQRVRDGEEVLVLDRDEPVARIVPVDGGDLPERERRLAARGILSLPRRRSPSSWPMPPGNVSDETMEQVWREERKNR